MAGPPWAAFIHAWGQYPFIKDLELSRNFRRAVSRVLLKWIVSLNLEALEVDLYAGRVVVVSAGQGAQSVRGAQWCSRPPGGRSGRERINKSLHQNKSKK